MSDRAQRWTSGLAGVVVVAAIAASLAIRLRAMLEQPNLIGTDPITRILYSEILRIQGWRALMDTTTWLPLHMWLLGWSNHVIDDPNLGSRLPTVVAGALTPWPAFLLAWRSWGVLAPTAGGIAAGERWRALAAGTVAAFAVAFEPLGYCYGYVSFAAPIAALLVLAAGAALIPIHLPIHAGPPRARPHRWLWAVPALMGATTLRYEAWIFVLLIPLAAPASWPRRIAAAAITLVPGLAWVLPQVFDVLQNSLVHENVGEAVPTLSEERLDALRSMRRALRRYASPTLWLGLLGFVPLMRRGATAVVPAIGLGLVAFLILLTLMGHVPMADRYLTISMQALCIGLGVTVAGLLSWPGPRLGRAVVGAMALALVVAQLNEFVAENRRWRIVGPPGLDEAAALLKHHHREAPVPVFIDPQGLTALYHYWLAEIPLAHIAGPHGHAAHLADYQGVIDDLAAGRSAPALLLLGDRTRMESALGVPPASCEPRTDLAGAWIECLGREGRWRLFRVHVDPPPS